MLPGEIDGTVDPRDYGFGVVKIEEVPENERRLAIASLYRDTLAFTGIEIPQLADYLKDEPWDPLPAQRLAEKHAHLPDPYECRFGRALLEIDRGVFCPSITSVSPFLLENIALPRKGKVLDAFTGSGAFAVNAALAGADVVAYDISPLAVACAEKNALRNGVSGRVDVREGTLQEVITGQEKFDLIIANPPLLPGDPQNPLEQALFDDGLNATTSFIAALPNLLVKKGRCFIVTSDVIERHDSDVDITQLCRENGLAVDAVAKLHKSYESYRVHRIEHPSLKTRIRPAVRWMLAH